MRFWSNAENVQTLTLSFSKWVNRRHLSKAFCEHVFIFTLFHLTDMTEKNEMPRKLNWVAEKNEISGKLN